MAVTPLKTNILNSENGPWGFVGTKMGFPPFLSEITAITSQKSPLEANWGVKTKPAVKYRAARRTGTVSPSRQKSIFLLLLLRTGAWELWERNWDPPPFLSVMVQYEYRK